MKTSEFLDYLIDVKARWEDVPSFRSIAREHWVSPCAIHKNIKYLIKYWYLKKIWRWKYELDLNSSMTYKVLYLRKRIKFLEQRLNEYVWCEWANEELERSYNKLRKSLDFQDKQVRILKDIVESQKKEIVALKYDLMRWGEKKEKKNWFKRLFS